MDHNHFGIDGVGHFRLPSMRKAATFELVHSHLKRHRCPHASLPHTSPFAHFFRCVFLISFCTIRCQVTHSVEKLRQSFQNTVSKNKPLMKIRNIKTSQLARERTYGVRGRPLPEQQQHSEVCVDVTMPNLCARSRNHFSVIWYLIWWLVDLATCDRSA